MTPAQRNRLRELAKAAMDARGELVRAGHVVVSGPVFDHAVETLVALYEEIDALTDFGTLPVTDTAAHPLVPFCPHCGIQPSRITGCECGKEARP